ncbi:MAG: hypothetical protein ACD_61C00299G0002 [uncultured bacterium]|nr:MAG: hypothetical protein ACD_61C00299G0002 [uncultured bacterium]
MSPDEVHDKSPNESVGEFFAWMAKKARLDGKIIYGRINGLVYSVGPEDENIDQAIDKFLDSLGLKGID